jgi:hypothetical protein
VRRLDSNCEAAVAIVWLDVDEVPTERILEDLLPQFRRESQQWGSRSVPFRTTHSLISTFFHGHCPVITLETLTCVSISTVSIAGKASHHGHAARDLES